MMTVVVDAEDLDDEMIGTVIELYEEEKAIMVIVMILMRIRIIVMKLEKADINSGGQILTSVNDRPHN